MVAALGILAHALHRLGAEVHGIELVDDLDHALVEETLRRLRIVVLGDRLDRHAVLPQQRLEQNRLLAIAREPVELVDQDARDGVLSAVRDHPAQPGSLRRRGVGGLAFVHEGRDEFDLGPFVDPPGQRLALRRNREVLVRLLVRGDAAVGDDLWHRRSPCSLAHRGGVQHRPVQDYTATPVPVVVAPT